MVNCPACGESVARTDRFCEACGASLLTARDVWRTLRGRASGPESGPPSDPLAVQPPPVRPRPVEAADPFEPLGSGSGSGEHPASPPPGRPADPATPADPSIPSVPSEELILRRDLDEVVDGAVAAVTGRGATHWRNEDAVGVRWIDGRPSGFVLVVCDGVSRSQEPQLVSQAAVDAALLVLSGAVAAGGDLDAAVVEATAAAQRAVATIPYDPHHDLGPGACTFVAAAVRGRRAAFASVGDSRAYWVDAGGAVQIGQDDSLAAELVASGRFTAREAMASAGAHALTKWLGVDSTDAAPSVTSVELPGPGLVVLASDGLWNYAPEPEDLARLIGPIGAERPLDLARRLAAFAEDAGGEDNITVAVGPHQLEGLDPRGQQGVG